MSYILYTYDLALPVIAAGMGKQKLNDTSSLGTKVKASADQFSQGDIISLTAGVSLQISWG